MRGALRYVIHRFDIVTVPERRDTAIALCRRYQPVFGRSAMARAPDIHPEEGLPRVDSAHAEATSAIQQSLERMAQAWNLGDAGLWAEAYWPTADSINILGGLMPDGLAIRDRHAEVFAGPFKGSHLAGNVRRVQWLGADVAIVDVDICVTKFRALPPGASATSPGVLQTRLKHIYQCRDGVWRIAASQNTAVVAGACPPPTFEK